MPLYYLPWRWHLFSWSPFSPKHRWFWNWYHSLFMSSPTCQHVISKWSLDIYICISDRQLRLTCHHWHRVPCPRHSHPSSSPVNSTSKPLKSISFYPYSLPPPTQTTPASHLESCNHPSKSPTHPPICAPLSILNEILTPYINGVSPA